MLSPTQDAHESGFEILLLCLQEKNKFFPSMLPAAFDPGCGPGRNIRTSIIFQYRSCFALVHMHCACANLRENQVHRCKSSARYVLHTPLKNMQHVLSNAHQFDKEP